MREDLPGGRLAGGGHALGVDRNHDALGAELLSRVRHEVRIPHGRRIDRDLVGTREEQGPYVLDRTQAATHRERHEASLRGAAYHVEQGAAGLVACRDVKEAELVSAGRV